MDPVDDISEVEGGDIVYYAHIPVLTACWTVKFLKSTFTLHMYLSLLQCGGFQGPFYTSYE